MRHSRRSKPLSRTEEEARKRANWLWIMIGCTVVHVILFVGWSGRGSCPPGDSITTAEGSGHSHGGAGHSHGGSTAVDKAERDLRARLSRCPSSGPLERLAGLNAAESAALQEMTATWDIHAVAPFQQPPGNELDVLQQSFLQILRHFYAHDVLPIRGTHNFIQYAGPGSTIGRYRLENIWRNVDAVAKAPGPICLEFDRVYYTRYIPACAETHIVVYDAVFCDSNKRQYVPEPKPESELAPGEGQATLAYCVDFQHTEGIIPSDTYSTIMAPFVFEHVPEPWVGFENAFRILKPGGVFIMASPFLYVVHPAPNDYWRFTPAGARQLMERAGFCVTFLDADTSLLSTVAAFAGYNQEHLTSEELADQGQPAGWVAQNVIVVGTKPMTARGSKVDAKGPAPECPPLTGSSEHFSDAAEVWHAHESGKSWLPFWNR